MSWMTRRRLEWALRVHGTEIAAWPAAERVAALSLMRRCGRARKLVADALAGEDAAPDPALLCRMRGRLQCCVARPSAPPAMRWGALAACALAGIYLGAATPEADQPDLFAAVQAIAIDEAL